LLLPLNNDALFVVPESGKKFVLSFCFKWLADKDFASWGVFAVVFFMVT